MARATMPSTSRTFDLGVNDGLDEAGGTAPSAPVTLLVLRPRTAPARVVAADPRAARREPRLGTARRRATARDGLVTQRLGHGTWRRRARPTAQDRGPAGSCSSRRAGRTRGRAGGHALARGAVTTGAVAGRQRSRSPGERRGHGGIAARFL